MISSSFDPRNALDALSRSWRVAFASGMTTFLVGVAVALEPGTSLVVLAILVGAEFLVSGVFRIARSIAGGEAYERALYGILGVLSILVGAILVRHFDLTFLLMSTLVGVIWIALGTAEITAGFGAERAGRLWLVGIGFLSVLGGIVILVYPVGSLLTLALLLGIWLMVRGAAEVSAPLAVRRIARRA